jgi:hypothetical protein
MSDAAKYTCAGLKTCKVTTYSYTTREDYEGRSGFKGADCSTGKGETYEAGTHCVDSEGKEYCYFETPNAREQHSFWCDQCHYWSSPWHYVKDNFYASHAEWTHNSIYVNCVAKN